MSATLTHFEMGGPREDVGQHARRKRAVADVQLLQLRQRLHTMLIPACLQRRAHSSAGGDELITRPRPCNARFGAPALLVHSQHSSFERHAVGDMTLGCVLAAPTQIGWDT